MRRRPDPDALSQLQGEITAFIRSLDHPVVVEDEVELFDLAAAEWRLEIEFEKLVFQAWNPARSIARRVEEIAYRDRERLGVFVRMPGGRQTSTLEFRSLEFAPRGERDAGRERSSQQLLVALKREFAGWRIERVSNRSDREHSFSAWYTRGWVRQGRTAWAFLGLSQREGPAAADAALAFGLVWLDWLRSHADGNTIAGLRLLLPRAALAKSAHRASCLNPRALRVELFEWYAEGVRAVDVEEFGNVAAELAPCRTGVALSDRHCALLRDWLGEFNDRVDVVPEASGAAVSVRVLGLEVARLEGELAPKIFWGLEGRSRRLDDSTRTEARVFLNNVLKKRAPESSDREHEYFRLHGERWLERQLLRDVTIIDPALSPAFVYPQVPAVSGSERGVIDMLGATRAGRLAVIELKLQEEINLPMQALDYWLRVKVLHERGRFKAAGYFSAIELAAASPLLFLVSPGFRFHSTLGRLVQYLDPSIEVIQVGLDNRWRESVRVLFRRERGAIV